MHSNRAGHGTPDPHPHPHPRFAGDRGWPGSHPRFAGDRGSIPIPIPDLPGIGPGGSIPIPIPDLPESGIQLSTIEYCKGVETVE